MRNVDVVQQALGLIPPWRVEDVEFDVEAGRMDLYLDFPSGSEFSCPEGGREDCNAYDTTEKTWRHLNLLEPRAYFHAGACVPGRVSRVRGQARQGLLDPGASGFTLPFDAFVLALGKVIFLVFPARIAGENDTRLWRILHHDVDRVHQAADFSAVRQVGVDETSAKRAGTTSRCSATWRRAGRSSSPKAGTPRPSATSTWIFWPMRAGPSV